MRAFWKKDYQDYLLNRKTTDKPLSFTGAIKRVENFWIDSLYNVNRKDLEYNKFRRTYTKENLDRYERIANAYLYSNSWKNVCEAFWISYHSMHRALTVSKMFGRI